MLLPALPLASLLHLLSSLLLSFFYTTSASGLGINCRGSLYCLGQDHNGVTYALLTLVKPIPSNSIYGDNAHIACLGASDVIRGNIGAFCLFMQGRNPRGIYDSVTGDRIIGIEGSLILEKTQELYDHGCRACGSVPIANNNDPDAEGILTINYVADNAGCAGNHLCPPTISANDSNNPLNAAQSDNDEWGVGMNNSAAACGSDPADAVNDVCFGPVGIGASNATGTGANASVSAVNGMNSTQVLPAAPTAVQTPYTSSMTDDPTVSSESGGEKALECPRC